MTDDNTSSVPGRGGEDMMTSGSSWVQGPGKEHQKCLHRNPYWSSPFPAVGYVTPPMWFYLLYDLNYYLKAHFFRRFVSLTQTSQGIILYSRLCIQTVWVHIAFTTWKNCEALGESPCLSFPTYKVGIVIVSTRVIVSRVVVQSKGVCKHPDYCFNLCGQCGLSGHRRTALLCPSMSLRSLQPHIFKAEVIITPPDLLFFFFLNVLESNDFPD